MSITQPYVDICISKTDAQGRTQVLGPTGYVDTGLGDLLGADYGFIHYKHLLLDTGANGILIVDAAAKELASKGMGSIGPYEELGVAGSSEYQRSEAVTFKYWGTDGEASSITLGNDVHVLFDPNGLLGGPIAEGGVPGIAGMSLMAGRVTTMDMTQFLNTEPNATAQLLVKFSDGLPAAHPRSVRYTVPVDTRVSFAPEDGIPPGSTDRTPPTWGPVTFLTAEAVNGNRRESGSFLFDTGAQMSMISTRIALGLGLDTNGNGKIDGDDDGAFAVSVGGVGGQATVYALPFDKFLVPTNEGPSLTWYGGGDPNDPNAVTPMYFLVLDIAPGIDGVFGADLWTGGMTTDYGFGNMPGSGFPGEVTGKPYFDKLSFDYRNIRTPGPDGIGRGQLVFDVDSQYAGIVTLPPFSVVESDNSTAVFEGGATDTQTVVLTQMPTGNITITVAGSAPLAATPQSLVFTPANWNVPQTVVIGAADNGKAEGLRLGTVTYTVSAGADPSFQGAKLVVSDVRINDQGPTAAFKIPSAAAVADKQIVSSGQSVAFDASTSSDTEPGRRIARYEWNFGDGSPVAVSTSPTGTTHVYAAPGPYTVTLTVFDDGTTVKSHVAKSTLVVAQDVAATDLGSVAPSTVLSEQWYRLTASNAGTLTLLSTADASLDLGGIALPAKHVISCYFPAGVARPSLNAWVADAATNSQRLDVSALSAGESIYVKVAGIAPNLRFRITNLVRQTGNRVDILGTAGDDSLTVDLSQGTFTIDGTSYRFQLNDGSPGAVGLTDLRFDGKTGVNSLTVYDTPRSETLFASPGALQVTGSGCDFNATLASQILFVGRGGGDLARLLDSPGADALTVGPDAVRLTGDGYRVELQNIAHLGVLSQGVDRDTASVGDSTGRDLFTGNLNTAGLSVRYPGRSVEMQGFETINVNRSLGGADTAFLLDSAGNDAFLADRTRASLSNGAREIVLTGFSQIHLRSQHGGVDAAQLTDPTGRSNFIGTPRFSSLVDAGFVLRIDGFASVSANHGATPGGTAYLFDSPGNDAVNIASNAVAMTGPAHALRVEGFARTEVAFSSASTPSGDAVVAAASTAADRLDVAGTWARMTYAQQAVVLSQMSAYSKLTATTPTGIKPKRNVAAHDYLLEFTDPASWTDVP